MGMLVQLVQGRVLGLDASRKLAIGVSLGEQAQPRQGAVACSPAARRRVQRRCGVVFIE